MWPLAAWVLGINIFLWGLTPAALQGTGLAEGETGAKPDGEKDPKAKNTPKDEDAPVDKPGKTGTEKETTAPLSIDDEYVREGLAAHLHPTKLEWLPDGRVKLMFDFTDKNGDMAASWTPKVSSEVNSKFRWALRGEYYGLRMSMEGQALLDCWFSDDVEVEATYRQGINHGAKQMFAVVFANASLKGIGCNFGTQCATFVKERIEKASGTVDSLLIRETARFKLVVRGGTFEAFRQGRSRAKQGYSPKTFASGKVGFAWGGGIAAGVQRLEITGRVDAKKMAPLLRKAQKR